jgi:hypothetical protein
MGSKFSSNLGAKPIYSSDISKKQYSINLTTQNCYLSNPIIKEIVVKKIADKFYYATKTKLTQEDEITISNYLNNLKTSTEVVYEILKEDKRKMNKVTSQSNIEILPIMKTNTNMNKVTSQSNSENLHKKSGFKTMVASTSQSIELLTNKVFKREIISLSNLEILSVKKADNKVMVTQLQVEIHALKKTFMKILIYFLSKNF